MIKFRQMTDMKQTINRNRRITVCVIILFVALFSANHATAAKKTSTVSIVALNISWNQYGCIESQNGEVYTNENWEKKYYCKDFYPIHKGDEILICLYAPGSTDCIAIYDNKKHFKEALFSDSKAITYTAEAEGFIRFSTDVTNTSIENMGVYIFRGSKPFVAREEYNSTIEYLKHVVESVKKRQDESDERIKSYRKRYYITDYESPIVNQDEYWFVPLTEKKEYRYSGQVSPQKRFLTIGVDDFRDSDFDMVLPLLEKYDGKATFNRIHSEDYLRTESINRILLLLNNGHELGDHTFFHKQYPYSDPRINGQDPDSVEGDQIPFPSNDEILNDRGDGKNVFAMDLSHKTKEYLSWFEDDTIVSELSKEQCQRIREHYSIMKNGEALIDVLDLLSNKYLGTTGHSNNSWDNALKCYTGGIFTGSSTSENHEIWERILCIVQHLYKEAGLNIDIKTWSLPGDARGGNGLSPFIYEDQGKYYYDKEHKSAYNYLARFYSTIEKKDRSWTDVLRRYGYTSTHDSLYPGLHDGSELKAMHIPFFFNEDLSRKDALVYPSIDQASFSSTVISTEFDDFVINEKKDWLSELYDKRGSFYQFVESIRNNTASGIIQCEALDSLDTYSERLFLEAVLLFCKKAGIEIITKQEVYDICFHHRINTGNLLYNPDFIHTAEKVLCDSDSKPQNPDGYIGDCHTEMIDSQRALVMDQDTYCIHYGIPYGNITYKVSAKGHGKIEIYTIKNNSDASLDDLQLLSVIDVDSDDFSDYESNMAISYSGEEKWDDSCESDGDKTMGIKIIYSKDIMIRYPYLGR